MTADKLICSGLLLLVICVVVFVPMEGSHATWLESLGSGLSGALFALFKGAAHAQQENKIEKSEVSIAQS